MAEPGDRLDSRLRDSAARWRAAQPRPAPPDLASLGAPGRRRSGLRAAAAAAAVAAVLGGVLVAVHLGGAARPSPAPPTAVRPGQVVPWRPLPATHPRIPTVTTPAVPDPAAAAAAPVCRAADLRASTSGGPAGGTVYLRVTLSLAGTHPCRLQGYPRLSPHTADGGGPIPVSRATDSSVYTHPVLVDSHAPASLQLSWGEQWCDPPIRNDRIALRLAPGSDSLSIPGFGPSSIVCDPSARRGPTAILTRTFEPLDTRPAEVRSAYDTVAASGDLERSAEPRGTVRFTVTLTSRRRLVLHPCPDVSISQGPPAPTTERFALNCRDVPSRDSSGQPYLPAGTPVRFAAEAPAGAAGVRRLSWVLDVPGWVGVVGTLRVGAARSTFR